MSKNNYVARKRSEKPEWTGLKQLKVTGNLLCPLTSAHALVVSQHISSRTHTLIRTKGVDTTEGTEQRILGAFIDIWNPKEGMMVYFNFKWCRKQPLVLMTMWLTFTSHHRSGFEALLAWTLKTSHHICAVSISTWVSYGALISVWRKEKAGKNREGN